MNEALDEALRDAMQYGTRELHADPDLTWRAVQRAQRPRIAQHPVLAASGVLAIVLMLVAALLVAH